MSKQTTKANKQHSGHSTHAGSKKPATPVLLGVPDGAIPTEDDMDPYTTKIGGVPVWLNSEKPPSSDYCRCRICHQWMYLIFQGYVPLPDSIYHRVIYVWACNRRACMRKPGSFSVLRSQRVDQETLQTQQKKEKKRKEQHQKKKNAVNQQQQQQQQQQQPFGGSGFQLGDLWGASQPFSTSSPSTPGLFGKASASVATPVAAPVASAPTSIPAKQSTKADELTESLGRLSLKMQAKDTVDVATLPRFPGEYLYISEENTDKYEMLGMDMSRYQQYLDMEAELMIEDTDEGTWIGEAYEKSQLPRGVDKQFKKFTERAECEPTQCVRYEWAGTPLLYSQLQQQQQQAIQERCKACGGPRAFEFQLMPNILSLLPTAEHAADNVGPVKSSDAKALLDSWNTGMEFGTIMVFVCQKDCHPGDIDEVAYVEEMAIVQYETE
ncbi:hypothetical protein DFQ28_009884 [Apophysomyces sp. BC1034]|nr:hypothetical protein DFQ30_009442 [Apophysomyces sp. BC1015]KAG0181586.1 hypothetical protein DFQ29_007846 [Apophysomyces sp. BC1021]KAG0192211.1 hypothetical protein DFQ28_009884 [Apophysomyces sp. BC1034]